MASRVSSTSPLGPADAPSRVFEPLAFPEGAPDRPTTGGRIPELVTVIVPCYNQGAFLRECLESVAAQDYPALETIVVDDGSDQATKAAILAAAASFAFTLITQENRGLSAARNAGLMRARGRFVLPLDADNRLAPDAVSQLVSTFWARHREDDRVAYVYQDKVWFGAEDNYVPHSEYNLFVLMQDNFSDACALIDREVLEAHHLIYDEGMRRGYEDWELFLRLGVFDKIGTRLAGRTFFYRRWGFSMVNWADEQRDDLKAYLRRQQGALYFPPVASGIKRAWAPGVTVLLADAVPLMAQTLQDRDARLARTEDDMMAALPSARGKYWCLVVPGQEGMLAEDPALLHKLVGFMERQPQFSGIRVVQGDTVVARLVHARRLLEERPVIESATYDALDRALNLVFPVPAWDVNRQTWVGDREAPVAVPDDAKPRRWARWLKDMGKRQVAPRIGFERAAGIYFHQRQVFLLMRRHRRARAPVPVSSGTSPASKGVGFGLVAPAAQEAGHRVEAGFRHWLPVNLDARPPMKPPLKAAALHTYRHAASQLADGQATPRVGVPAQGAGGHALVLGHDGETVQGLVAEGYAVTVADLSLAGLEAQARHASGVDVRDLAFWTPSPLFDGVVVTGGLRAVLGQEADRLAQAAMKPNAWSVGVVGRRHPARVLVVAPCLVTGGADRAILDLLPVLTGAPYEVYLATTEPSQNPWLRHALPYVKEYWDVGALAPTDGDRVALLVELARRWDIDAVYLMHSRVGFDALPDLRRARGVPVVAQFHLEEPVGHGGWVFYALSRYGNLIDRLVTVSHQLAARLETAYYAPADKIRTIHLGVPVPDAVPPPPPADRLQVLYPARLAEQKAPLTLVAIAKELKRHQVPLTIHVLGNGPLAETLAAAVAKEHLDPWISLHDFAPKAAMTSWYARVHATLLTSAWEGLPLVLLESLAHGRPVMAPDVGAVCEIVGPDTGALVSHPDRIAEYVDTLTRWAADPSQLTALGLTGRRRVQTEFSPEETGREYLALFSELW